MILCCQSRWSGRLPPLRASTRRSAVATGPPRPWHRPGGVRGRLSDRVLEGDQMDELEGRAYACLIAGLVGDAMGTPTENLEPNEIERQFGWVNTCSGPGTDDSLMKDLLCDALIATDGYATADDWAAQ